MMMMVKVRISYQVMAGLDATGHRPCRSSSFLYDYYDDDDDDESDAIIPSAGLAARQGPPAM